MILTLSRRWSFSAMVIAFIICAPLVALAVQSLAPSHDVFRHLANTVLSDYVINTLMLVGLVAVGALVLALPAAFWVARCQFPGRSWLQWALLLPLSMPAYIVAYIYTDLLDYAGPVQRGLRWLFEWQGPQDYSFWQVRSLSGAAVMLALVLFPYIYLLGRTAFTEQSISLPQAAKVMGASSWQIFWRVSLPLARPALAVGVSLVAMETAADFATVSYFAVPTLTTGVYDAWLGYGSMTTAARLSMMILLLVLVLVGSERFARRKQQLFQKSGQGASMALQTLPRLQGWLISAYCLTLLLFAFIVPMLVLLHYSIDYFEVSWHSDFWRYSLNSLSLAIVVSLLCILLALCLQFVSRVSPRPLDALPARVSTLGYTLPGTVLAIAVLIPLTWLDFAINDSLRYLGLAQPGLLLTGSLIALVLAFCIRFAAIAIGSVEGSYKRISPSLDMAALTMGAKPLGLFLKVHLPLLKKGILAGMLLVFIESMKELPAALLLRPIGYENLATYVFQYVSDEQLEHAALGAVVIVLVGLLPLFILNRSMEQK
ncbi:iron ABC transporter permease [Shewanella sp. NIFS-20-20]|uniref:ABC transporter permease n=1 Tax=Shewanella sp. NIFS-20-20 TaxID=2853806 RepID=UPI001C46B8CA|nr:iron ABC transporter permease [Shewanella sp. NIFS-20-20]MBV7314649.1 iron ABC transporter permease [Shewanella sp. NIFS-20-20]